MRARIVLAALVGIAMMFLLIALVPYNRDTSTTYWITAASFSIMTFILAWKGE